MEASHAEERRRMTLERAVEEIEGLDLAAQARMGGFELRSRPEGGSLLILPSFGRHITIAMPGGSVSMPALIESFSLRVLALRYVKLSCGIPESGDWISYRDLPGGRFYAATLAPTVEIPLARLLGTRRGALEEVSRPLGGVRAGYGDESFVFRPFPRTPLLVVMHWGDEEFEPGCRVLFDRCCSHYLNTDDLKVLATQLAALLMKSAGAAAEAENLLWMVD